ncbi:heme-binding protein [Pseudomonas silvicola]|nr:heme-binding protein [Pseudomonas silvicola]
MPTLTLDQAQTALHGALQAARSHQFRPMAIVVVDTAGTVVAAAREDGATPLRMTIATGKACAAIGMGANTRLLAKKAGEMPAFFGSIATSSQHPFVPQTGAMLMLDASGAVVGAIGASGGTGDEDELIVTVGIDAAGLAAR